MKHIGTIVVIALVGGCGAPFVEETAVEDCDIYIADPGEFEAPSDDVEAYAPRTRRASDADAGTDGSP